MGHGDSQQYWESPVQRRGLEGNAVHKNPQKGEQGGGGLCDVFCGGGCEQGDGAVHAASEAREVGRVAYHFGGDGGITVLSPAGGIYFSCVTPVHFETCPM